MGGVAYLGNELSAAANTSGDGKVAETRTGQQADPLSVLCLVSWGGPRSAGIKRLRNIHPEAKKPCNG